MVFRARGLPEANRRFSFPLIYLPSTICSEFQVSPTADLGVNVGVQLAHSRPTKLLQHLVDKAHQNLLSGSSVLFQKQHA